MYQDMPKQLEFIMDNSSSIRNELIAFMNDFNKISRDYLDPASGGIEGQQRAYDILYELRMKYLEICGDVTETGSNDKINSVRYSQLESEQDSFEYVSLNDSGTEESESYISDVDTASGMTETYTPHVSSFPELDFTNEDITDTALGAIMDHIQSDIYVDNYQSWITNIRPRYSESPELNISIYA